MSQTLRPYQVLARDAVYDALIFDELKRVLYVLSTGAGKTTTFADLVRLFDEHHDYKVLVLAHRFELVNQAYFRIKDHCNFTHYQIGMEIADKTAPPSAVCVVGSIWTVVNVQRLADWTPDVIIYDEAHHAGCDTAKKIFARWPDALIVGCTATPGRSDKKSLFAVKENGEPVMLLDKKKNTKFEATAKTSVFEKLVYSYKMSDAINDGYNVPMVGHGIETDTDLSAVPLGTDGDYKKAALSKEVNTEARTNAAIKGWKRYAENKSTMVFCSSVEHADAAAALWRQAGYTAESLCGETDTVERAQTIGRFNRAETQCLMNYGLFTEGADFPGVACVVMMRPTKLDGLYKQMAGRGARVLPGVIDGIEDAEGRKRAIAASAKSHCVVLDLVDVCEQNDLCALPCVLELPSSLKLSGQSVTDAEKLLLKFEEAKGHIVGECPMTYRDVEIRVRQVELIKGSGAKSPNSWAVNDRGAFTYKHSQPGYHAELIPDADGKYRLKVEHKKGLVRESPPISANNFTDVLNSAGAAMERIIDKHQAKQPKPALGTALKLQSAGTGGWYRTLIRNNFTHAQIDTMPYAQASKLAGDLAGKYRQKKAAAGLPAAVVEMAAA